MKSKRLTKDQMKHEMDGIQGKVLLIDDDLIFGKIIKTAAHDFGMNVDTMAETPSRRKVDKLKGYDLVLLDYDLEGTTGFAFAEVLQKHLPELPVILISSSNRPYQDKLSRLPNIIGFVSKWSNPEDFFLRSAELYRANRGPLPHEKSWAKYAG